MAYTQEHADIVNAVLRARGYTVTAFTDDEGRLHFEQFASVEDAKAAAEIVNYVLTGGEKPSPNEED